MLHRGGSNMEHGFNKTPHRGTTKRRPSVARHRTVDFFNKNLRG
jgi:hypothetical protein